MAGRQSVETTGADNVPPPPPKKNTHKQQQQHKDKTKQQQKQRRTTKNIHKNEKEQKGSKTINGYFRLTDSRPDKFSYGLRDSIAILSTETILISPPPTHTHTEEEYRRVCKAEDSHRDKTEQCLWCIYSKECLSCTEFFVGLGASFLSMRRAAQFCMRRRLWTEEAGRPERRELQ